MEVKQVVFRIFIILVIVGLALVNEANHCLAHDDAEWNPSSAGPLITWTAPLCDQGKFVIQPFFFYNRAMGTFNENGYYEPLPSGEQRYQFQEILFMQYGITERLEIDGQLIYQQNYANENTLNADTSGLSDSNIFLKYCVAEEEGWLPQVTALFQLKLPTGKYQNLDPGKLETDLMGTGSWDHGYGIILTKKLRPFLLHLDAVYNFPLETQVDNIQRQYGEYLICDAGIEYFLPAGFSLMMELNSVLIGSTKESGKYMPNSAIKYLSIGSGLGWSNEVLQVFLGYQKTINGTNIDAIDSIAFDFVYTF